MGFMDKLSQQAEQAMAKAKEGLAQGQAKVDQLQAKRHADALLRDLGAAYYAQARQAGSPDAVTAAMAALDAYSASGAPIDTTQGGSSVFGGPSAPPPGASWSAPGSGPAAPAPGASWPSPGGAARTTDGDYKLDDI